MNNWKSLGRELLDVIHLSRWANTIFIAVLQISAFLFIDYFDDATAMFFRPYLLALIMSTVLIAAAGYLINDYFDFNIDKINRPRRTEVIQRLGKRNLIKWHVLMSALGILLACYAAYEVGKLRLVIFQLISVLFLFLYSFYFKKIFLAGNIVIGLLSTLSIVIVAAYAYHTMVFPLIYNMIPKKLSFILILLCTFSFLLTILREILKDTEDIKGDLTNECKTLPIVLGISNTKRICFLFAIGISAAYAYYFRALWNPADMAGLVCFSVFLFCMIFILYRIPISQRSQDFALLSNWVKLTMILGLASCYFLLPYV